TLAAPKVMVNGAPPVWSWKLEQPFNAVVAGPSGVPPPPGFASGVPPMGEPDVSSEHAAPTNVATRETINKRFIRGTLAVWRLPGNRNFLHDAFCTTLLSGCSQLIRDVIQGSPVTGERLNFCPVEGRGGSDGFISRSC